MITDEQIKHSMDCRKTVISRLQGTMQVFHERTKDVTKGHSWKPDRMYKTGDGSLVAVNTVLEMRKRLKHERRMLRVLRRRKTKWL